MGVGPLLPESCEFVGPSLETVPPQGLNTGAQEWQAVVDDQMSAQGDGQIPFHHYLPNHPDILPIEDVMGSCDEVGIIAQEVVKNTWILQFRPKARLHLLWAAPRTLGVKW